MIVILPPTGKNSALEFKNDKLIRYFINLIKTNGLKFNYPFVIIKKIV